MPMWHGSAKSEHLAVLTHAGLFDTSHMDTLTVRGRQAHALPQHCFTKDPDRCRGPNPLPLSQGRCVCGAFLNEQGHVRDQRRTVEVEVVTDIRPARTARQHLKNFSG